jgi:hypothetical protein
MRVTNDLILEDIIKVVDSLNERGMQEGPGAMFHVATNEYSTHIMMLGHIVLWDSDEDEREEIGTCERCGGTGNFEEDRLQMASSAEQYCAHCGGDGRGEPKEPLGILVAREAARVAREILTAVTPRPDAEPEDLCSHDTANDEELARLIKGDADVEGGD